jgi:hypothetical protein
METTDLYKTCKDCGELAPHAKAGKQHRPYCRKCYFQRKKNWPSTKRSHQIQAKRHKQKYRERINRSARLRRKAVKRDLFLFMGGKCKHCNLIDDCLEVYDFHHADGEQKESNISLMILRVCNFERIKNELAKCVMLCSNCHRRLHAKDRATKLGGGA